MICGIHNDKLDRTIGVGTMPNRKKLCLIIKERNCETKYATFNNDESAAEFMRKLAEMMGLEWGEEE